MSTGNLGTAREAFAFRESMQLADMITLI